ncbi:hypothetical protein [Conexibacter sp. SYSU D00693]|uniref:hypothetical protein n=1 Tax=Conexibacter sp. SYSU D00693 TaxID=2812560 RepID=UPI00196A89AE|nr:hypothetical protein [Conexibacter sp. SYSU D00693]
MTTLEVEGERVVVRFSGRHAVMALARSVSVPLASVRSATVVPDSWQVRVGWRLGGTFLPRRLAFGRFRKGQVRTFAAMYAGEPAVLLELEGDHWDRLCIAVEDAEAAVRRITAATGQSTDAGG